MSKGSGGTGRGKGGGGVNKTSRTSQGLRADRVANKLNQQLDAISREKMGNAYNLKIAQRKRFTSRVNAIKKRQKTVETREEKVTKRLNKVNNIKSRLE